MEATPLVAWWGAGVASLVLAWDIYKWKQSGSKVTVSASPDMELHSQVPDILGDNTYILVNATNNGNRSTTITHLVMFHYTSIYNRIRRKRSKAVIIVTPISSHPLPHRLEPGGLWTGFIDQNKELEEMSRNGYMYCGVYHSSRKKPVLKRVVTQYEDVK